MVDERFEAEQYLAGKGIVKSNLYRTYSLLARWCKEQHMTRYEARKEIVRWCEEHKQDAKYDINSILTKVFDTCAPILKSQTIKINKQDVKHITDRFCNNSTKLVALAILCYAKAFADQNDEFSLSSVGLSAWLSINRKSLRNRYIKELIDYEYISEISKPQNSKQWTEKCDDLSIRYKINVPIHNSGDFILKKNNVRILFSELFSDSK